MRAHVIWAGSDDIDVDGYASEEPHDDGVWIRLLVGPDGDQGEESFDVLVCTPTWIGRKIAADGPVIGRHHLLVDPLDLGAAIAFLRSHVESLEGADWNDLGEKIARIGHWEFEDYHEHQAPQP